MGSGALEEDRPSLRVRAFFGLPVPEPQRDELARFIDECAQVAPEFRWTPRDNLHLTIRFVGNVEQAVVEGVADALVDRSLPGVELELGGVGTFGRGHAIRVVWLGLRAGAGEAGALAAQVNDECIRAGLDEEKRPYRAHLTLARARPRYGAGLHPLPPAPELNGWRAGELILYSSRLTNTGAIYEAIRSLPLL